MSLRIRCSSCRRGTSGRHRFCTDCRGASSAHTTVYVAESGARIEVTTDAPSRPSSPRHGECSSASREAAYYGHHSSGSYTDAGRYLGRDERDIERDITNGYPYAYDPDTRQNYGAQGGTYVLPRVHPYAARYEYTSAGMQPGYYASHDGVYLSGTQRDSASSSHSGYREYRSESYHPQSSHARTQQTRGQGNQIQFVYSGTEGPDGEIVD